MTESTGTEKEALTPNDAQMSPEMLEQLNKLQMFRRDLQKVYAKHAKRKLPLQECIVQGLCYAAFLAWRCGVSREGWLELCNVSFIPQDLVPKEEKRIITLT